MERYRKKLKRREKIKQPQKSKAAAKDNKVVAIFRFSYRNGRLNCWIFSKIFVVNFELIDHINQYVSVDFEHFFCAGLLWNPRALTRYRIIKNPSHIIKCVIPMIIHVLRIRRNILFFDIIVSIYYSKWSNDFYSFAVLTFYDLSFLPFLQLIATSSFTFSHPAYWIIFSFQPILLAILTLRPCYIHLSKICK